MKARAWTLALAIGAAGAAFGGVNWYAVDPMAETPYMPDSAPRNGVKDGTVRIVAAKGEYEPGSFVLVSDTDLGKVQLEIGDLKQVEKAGGGGERETGVVFPKDKIDLRNVKVWYQAGTDQYEPYVRPQDNGYKCDVRWVEFADAAGKGVRFSSDVPMFVQALHYGKEDMEFSRHRGDERRYRAPLVPREEVLLNLDLRQTGLGGGSCGPLPLDKYRFEIAEERWTYQIEPL